MNRWDAGELGCGQLIRAIADRMEQLAPGEALDLTTQDAGAPIDLAAWCRMTGNTLELAEHPRYIIRRTSPKTS